MADGERVRGVLTGRPTYFNGELRAANAAVKREFEHAIVGVMEDGAVARRASADRDGWYGHARLLRESARRASSKLRCVSLAHINDIDSLQMRLADPALTAVASHRSIVIDDAARRERVLPRPVPAHRLSSTTRSRNADCGV